MHLGVVALNYSELSQKPGLFKEKNAVFSAQIHKVTLTKTWFKKKHLSSTVLTRELFNAAYLYTSQTKQYYIFYD